MGNRPTLRTDGGAGDLPTFSSFVVKAAMVGDLVRMAGRNPSVETNGAAEFVEACGMVARNIVVQKVHNRNSASSFSTASQGAFAVKGPNTPPAPYPSKRQSPAGLVVEYDKNFLENFKANLGARFNGDIDVRIDGIKFHGTYASDADAVFLIASIDGEDFNIKCEKINETAVTSRFSVATFTPDPSVEVGYTAEAGYVSTFDSTPNEQLLAVIDSVIVAVCETAEAEVCRNITDMDMRGEIRPPTTFGRDPETGHVVGVAGTFRGKTFDEILGVESKKAMRALAKLKPGDTVRIVPEGRNAKIHAVDVKQKLATLVVLGDDIGCAARRKLLKYRLEDLEPVKSAKGVE